VKTRIGSLFLLAAVILLQPIVAPRLWAQSAPTLLATTDLDCTWKLDGKPQGTLKADDATVVPLSLGKHLVQATSADGFDQWKAVVTVTQAAQEMVEIKLKEARQQRIAGTPPTQPEAQPTTQPAAQPATETPAQPAIKSAATEPAPQPAIEPSVPRTTPPTEDPTWTDPVTHLMWAARDNGKNVTWPEANTYCGSLTLGGFSNWRLPTVDELASIYDETQDVNGWHIKGGIRITGWEWSSEARGADHRLFTFRNVKKAPIRVAFARRALCVRPTAQ
jgi:hypothetical protein